MKKTKRYFRAVVEIGFVNDVEYRAESTIEEAGIITNGKFFNRFEVLEVLYKRWHLDGKTLLQNSVNGLFEFKCEADFLSYFSGSALNVLDFSGTNIPN